MSENRDLRGPAAEIIERIRQTNPLQCKNQSLHMRDERGAGTNSGWSREGGDTILSDGSYLAFP